jgi:hypothetical protein
MLLFTATGLTTEGVTVVAKIVAVLAGITRFPPGGLNEVGSQRRLADHLPEHVPREPTPRQVPPPEVADNRPLPLALCSPEATLTLTAPLLATLPRTGIPPEP